MYKLKVISDKLNIRSTPVADHSFANWIGDMSRGEEYTAIDIVRGEEYNGVPYWYKDSFNRFSSITGVGDNDPRIDWSLRILGIPHIWAISKGQGVKIAMVDSGIDLGNNDLSNAVPLNNRFNILDGTTNVQDSHYHGTFCSSIAASRGNNGLLGVAPASELIVIKIANSGSDYTSDTTIPGIKKAIQSNADIISMSFGSMRPNTEIINMLNTAMSAGKICIASTGNSQEDNVRYPANIKGLISVGNVSCIDQSAQFGEGLFAISKDSNGGVSDDENEGVTIVAPGDGVSTYDIGGQIWSPISGSSYATPFVAGVAALWLSVMKRKGITNINYHKKFRDFIIATALKNFNGYNSRSWGSGVINPISILSI